MNFTDSVYSTLAGMILLKVQRTLIKRLDRRRVLELDWIEVQLVS